MIYKWMIKYYIIKDFAFYEYGLCKSLTNHFDTFKVYKEFYLKTKNKEVDPIYENDHNLNFFHESFFDFFANLIQAFKNSVPIIR